MFWQYRIAPTIKKGINFMLLKYKSKNKNFSR